MRFELDPISGEDIYVLETETDVRAADLAIRAFVLEDAERPDEEEVRAQKSDRAKVDEAMADLANAGEVRISTVTGKFVDILLRPPVTKRSFSQYPLRSGLPKK